MSHERMTNDELCRRVVASAKEAIGDALAENAALLVYQELVRDAIVRGDVVHYEKLAPEAWFAGRAFAKARGDR